MSVTARNVIAGSYLRDGGEALDDCYPLHRDAAYDIADRYLSALTEAGYVVVKTGLVHRELQDAFQSGGFKAVETLQVPAKFLTGKHIYCDAALARLMKVEPSE